MNQPSLELIRRNVDSRYTMVVIAAKRARQLLDGAPPLVETESTKPVSIALEELAQNKLRYERTKTGIK